MRALLDAVAPQTFHDLYPGRVVDDRDPLKRGRVRVRVEQVYGDPLSEDEYIPDNALPWAYVNCLTGGPGTGREWTPPKKSEVLVGSWGGDWERPIVVGAYHPAAAQDTGDQRVPEHTSSYTGDGPKTFVQRTEGGQVMEMRWVPGQEQYHITMKSGTTVVLNDVAGNIFVDVETPLGFRLRLDEKLMQARVETPGERSVVLDDIAMSATLGTPTQTVALDDAAQTVSIDTPGIVNGTAGGAMNLVAGAAMSLEAPSVNISTAIGILVLPIVLTALAITLNAAAVIFGVASFALTSIGPVSLLGAAVVIGSVAGTKRALLDARAWAFYLAHTHNAPAGGGATSSPLAPNNPAVGLVSTSDTTAS